MNCPDRWQDCEAFIEALLQRKYVTKDEANNVGPLMADGIYIYMYELWRDGRDAEREDVRAWLCDAASHEEGTYAHLAIEIEQGSHVPSSPR